jgi:ribonuclease P protein component
VRGGRQTVVVHLIVEPTVPAPAAVGFVVSKAVGNSVTRNRVKRRLRAIVATRVGDLAPGTMAVLRALPAAAGSDFAGLTADVEAGLSAAAKRWAQRQVDTSGGGRR